MAGVSQATIPKQMWFTAKTDIYHDPTNTPTAYLTYYEDNAAFLKRKETATKFNGMLVAGTKVLEDTFDNVPVEGMQIVNVTHGRSLSKNNDLSIMLIDPRGFKVEVAAAAVIELARNATMVDGVIQQPCVWGRYAGVNIPLVVGTPEYELAKRRTVDKYIPVRQLNVGDQVLLNDTSADVLEVTFAGAFDVEWEYTDRTGQQPSDSDELITVTDSERLYVFQYRKSSDMVGMHRYLTSWNPAAFKVCEVVVPTDGYTIIPVPPVEVIKNCTPISRTMYKLIKTNYWQAQTNMINLTRVDH